MLGDCAVVSAPGATPMLRMRAHLLSQWRVEFPLITEHWRRLLLVAVWQYVHKVGTNIAYYLHRPGPLLYDLGFEALPELGPQWQFLSETVFLVLFISGLGTCVSPLFMRFDRPRSATVMLMRFFTCASVAQTLRVASFLSTLLPGPNYHCRPGSPEYNPPTPLEIFTRLDALKGCGDLIFSSHTIFTTLCCLTVQKYTNGASVKRLMWVLLFVMGLLVIAARKHYSVDVVVAWYTTPLVWFFLDKTLPDPDVSGGSSGGFKGDYQKIDKIDYEMDTHTPDDEESELTAASHV